MVIILVSKIIVGGVCPSRGLRGDGMVIILVTKLILGAWKDNMNQRWVLGIARTVGAGIAGGVTFIILTFVTFALIGHGPLSDPGLQSPKVLAVLNELEPLPLFATKPHVIFLGYLLFSISHALLFRSVADAWPAGAAPRREEAEIADADEALREHVQQEAAEKLVGVERQGADLAAVAIVLPTE